MDKFIDSLKYSLIDSNNNLISHEFTPIFITNQDSTNNVLNNLRDELKKCKEFYFSIAFITKNGLLNLKMKLDELKEKGIKGKIITADYLYFNNPDVFEDLLNIENIEVRICKLKNFHPKGYIFKQSADMYSVIVGSANITEEALQNNVEWNLKFNSFKEGNLFKKIKAEFDYQWENSKELTREWINEYRKIYDNYRLQNTQKIVNEHDKNVRFEPNKMQQEALESLNLLREHNQNKALIVSATGTGKTYLAVFDVKQFNPNKILFIAHRDNILRSAKESFEFEFENSKTYGFINGQEKEFNKDFIFASSSTLNKDENLFKFNKDHFDYIIVDEAHHSAANSIEKIIKYFKPKFLLGLTATPNRTDGKEIYSLYANNIAYEINLKKALENNLLCRFNYFGINDKFLLNTNNAKELCNEDRINYIIEKAKYYGCYNNKVQGLIFVSSKSEAKLLTKMFNNKGIRTKYILSETKDNDKIAIINELRERKIDYIVSVDVLSEGVDMPFVNQIIMLRPTKSTIVFSQQLGRGLRKYHDEFNYKDYLVVLDFIGNYDDNFLIPIALSNTTKIDKDNIKKTLVDIKYEEFNCNIEFDRISEEKIVNSIDKSTTKIKVMFKEEIEELKVKLNKVPTYLDIYRNNKTNFFEISNSFKNGTKKIKSYIEYLINNEYLDKNLFSELELKYFEFFDNEVINGKDLELIQNIEYIIEDKIDLINKKIIPILDSSFFSKSYISLLDNQFKKFINSNMQFKKWILNILQCAKEIYENKYKNNDLFKINQEYSRKDVCKLIKLENNQDNTIYGYRVFEDQDRFVIFVTYKKSNNISKSQNYHDNFLNKKIFNWETRNQQYNENKDISSYEDFKKILNWANKNKKVDLFIKKSDYESKSFYYLGKCKILNDSIKKNIWRDENKEKIKLLMKLELENEVDYKLYEYFND